MKYLDRVRSAGLEEHATQDPKKLNVRSYIASSRPFRRASRGRMDEQASAGGACRPVHDLRQSSDVQTTMQRSHCVQLP